MTGKSLDFEELRQLHYSEPVLRHVHLNRREWFVECSICGASPKAFGGEADAVRGAWLHQETRVWPRWVV